MATFSEGIEYRLHLPGALLGRAMLKQRKKSTSWEEGSICRGGEAAPSSTSSYPLEGSKNCSETSAATSCPLLAPVAQQQ